MSLCFAGALLAQQHYDLVVRGGEVIDPKNHLYRVADVAIRDHKIAAIAPNLANYEAGRVIDAAGLVVTPGLIDIHVHIYAGTGRRAYDGDNSVYPDGFTFRSGVTTVADAGSSGWKNFPDFKDRVIDRSKTRVLAFLNIVGAGMDGPLAEQNASEMDAPQAAAMVQRYPEVIVGIKTAHWEAPDWTAVDRAIEAGTLANVPVMVDFGAFPAERPYRELVTRKLRPGDISTHMYLRMIDMLDEQGKVKPYFAEARKRGVIFDVGHGGGSFVFRLAVPAMRQGWAPDSISTDLHTGSMNGGMKDMLNVMSKFLNLGMSLEDVILRSTYNPAKEIRHPELGSLSVGSDADLAVLRVEKGKFGFVDSSGMRMDGDQKLVCELTIRDGRVVWDLNGIAHDDWKKYPNSNPPAAPDWDQTVPRH
jgi:dihydroorotase